MNRAPSPDDTPADAVFKAAIDAPHSIDHERVVLQFDPSKPGHNALNQLHTRLAKAWQAAMDSANQGDRSDDLGALTGWALVPQLATDEMMEAFAGVPIKDLSPAKRAAELKAYADMLKAAPRAPECPLSPRVSRIFDYFIALHEGLSDVVRQVTADEVAREIDYYVKTMGANLERFEEFREEAQKVYDRTLAAMKRVHADRAERESMLRVRIWQGDAIVSHTVAMQAALIDGLLVGPKEGLRWIYNTLRGPGHLPDLDEAKALGGAQAWFNAKTAEHEAFREKNPGPAPLPEVEPHVLTSDEVVDVAKETRTAEPGRDGYILPWSFARALFAAAGVGVLRDGMPVSRTERHVRRLLCAARHGAGAYFDDGEASWGGDEDCPPIDYMRMAPDAIEAIWREAGVRKYEKQVAAIVEKTS